MHWKLGLGLFLTALLLVFGIQNAETVQIRFLIWDFTLSRALLLFLVFALGLMVGWFGNSVQRAMSNRV